MKRIVVITLVTLLSVAGARGQGFDREARERSRQMAERIREINEALRLERAAAEDAVSLAKERAARERAELVAEVHDLAAAEDGLRSEIARIERDLANRRERLIDVIVRRHVAAARLETMTKRGG